MNHSDATKSVPRAQDEKNVYVGVYRLLIAGMLVSTTLFAIGLVIALLHPAYYPLSADWLRQQYRWATVLHGFRTGDANSFMILATVVLILTPVMRVIVSVWTFFVDRDYHFVAVTSTVLLIIVVSVILGFAGLQ